MSDDNMISFSTTHPFGSDVTQHHLLSLCIIETGHNFKKNINHRFILNSFCAWFKSFF